jgi:hypothetical protein
MRAGVAVPLAAFVAVLADEGTASALFGPDDYFDQMSGSSSTWRNPYMKFSSVPGAIS